MSENLGTYLNDHVAGSVLALELLDHLIDLPEALDRKLLAQLRAEIQEDQDVLRQLLRSLGAKESTARKAAAWLTEKLGCALRPEHDIAFDIPGPEAKPGRVENRQQAIGIVPGARCFSFGNLVLKFRGQHERPRWTGSK